MSYNYNEISKLYDDVREADFQAAEFLIQSAAINEKSRVLEVGCGTGNYLRLMQQLAKTEAWGLDSSPGMLSRAREKCPGVTLLEGDAVELAGVPDTAFDLVYMVDVIHHIRNIDRMFASINRVLKPNAPVIIFTDSHEHIRNRLTTKYFPETLEAELKRYQDTEEIRQTLLKNSFSHIKTGTLELPAIENYGSKLIEIAEKKGYSMFGLISEEAIQAGIERIKADMQKHPITYHQRAPYIIAYK